MSIPPEQAETAAFLAGLAGAPPIETHISLVFVGRDRVWKLKKAVRLPFLDFTAPDDRHRFCDRELALNAPFAAGLYRDVAPVVRRADGTMALDVPGQPVDWVVRMARVPAEDFLDVRAANAGLTGPELDAIADAVAAYHAALPPLAGIVPDMAWIAKGNLASALAAGLPVGYVRAWHEGMTAAIAARAGWFAARAAAGFVRRCHGDLHLGNLCLRDGGPVPFDALEFDEALATIDTGYDLAFLLMDLEHRIDRAAANRVLNRYIARTADVGLLAGLPVFLSMRAMVRAHVEARSGHAGAGESYLRAALRDLVPRPPVVVAIGGLPGSGKSGLGRALAPLIGVSPGALLVRSDELRKRQHGVRPETRLGPDAYTPEKSAAVFATLAATVEDAARAGQAVVADATFMLPAHRAMVEQAARRAGVPFVGIWLNAPLPVLEQRVAARVGDASDATVAVLHAAAAADPGPGGWCAIDAVDGARALTLAKVLVRGHIFA